MGVVKAMRHHNAVGTQLVEAVNGVTSQPVSLHFLAFYGIK